MNENDIDRAARDAFRKAADSWGVGFSRLDAESKRAAVTLVLVRNMTAANPSLSVGTLNRIMLRTEMWIAE